MSPRSGHYSLKRPLGQALYGEVWLCEADRPVSDEAPAEVAIKQVNLRFAKQALSQNPHMDNPWQERKIAELLSVLGPHPNVLQFHEDYLENGNWNIVMEYCNGGDLLGLLEQVDGNRFVESVALHLFLQIAEGLRFLHQHNIAHRDLSLENVLVHDRICKLSDFGLSTDANRICTERVGKAYYMAPEVVAESEYDPVAADVWSLGIMLFIMLTGAPLVQVASVEDKAFLALKTFGVKKILEAWGMGSDVTSSTIDLLSSMLDTNPSKRPTVEEILQHPVLERLFL